MIDLTVKTLDARNHEFSVDDECTVLQLKGQITTRIGLATDMQRLIFRGRVLADDGKLADLDVAGKVVHLVEREPPSQRAPAAPPAPATDPTAAPPRHNHARFARLQGPFTTDQMEHAFMETMGIRGYGSDDLQPQVGPTIERMQFARRLIQELNRNVSTLDSMSANPLHRSSAAPSTSGSTPEGAPTAGSSSECGGAEAARPSPGEPAPEPPAAAAPEPMLTDSPSNEEEVMLLASEEWLGASEEPAGAAPAAPAPAAPAATAAAPPTSGGEEGAAPSPGAARTTTANIRLGPLRRDEAATTEGARTALAAMTGVLRDLGRLHGQVSTHLNTFAEALTEQFGEEDWERMRFRQREVRRTSDVLHSLAHVYHALSDVDVLLAPAAPARLLSQPAPRRVQIPIQTQINVMSNRRPNPAAGAAAGAAAAAAAAAFGQAATNAANNTSNVSVTTSSSATNTTATATGQTPAEGAGQPGRSQPTVHVDIRPEPLSYQVTGRTALRDRDGSMSRTEVLIDVEIETRVPIAFAINNAQLGGLNAGLPPGLNAAGMANAAMAGLNAAAANAAAANAARLGGSAPSGPAAAAGAAPAVPAPPAGLSFSGLFGGLTGAARAPGAAPAAAPVVAATGAQPAAAPNTQRAQGQAFRGGMFEQGGDFIMGLSVPLNWENMNQAPPQLIAGPFPFGGGANGADFLQNIVQSALGQEVFAAATAGEPSAVPAAAAASNATPAAAAAAASDRRPPPVLRSRFRRAQDASRGAQRVAHSRTPFHERPPFDAFLPCRYETQRLPRVRRAMQSEAGGVRARLPRSNSAPRTFSLHEPYPRPTFADLLTALNGYSISDFIEMDQHLPGESWLVDILMLISRQMSPAELLAAWTGGVGALESLRAPLREFVRSTVLAGATPRDAAHALQLYADAADTFVDQNRDNVRWMSELMPLRADVDVERSLRALARARLPQLLLTLTEEGAAGSFGARVTTLLARLFGDACALLQHCSVDLHRQNALRLLFWGYIEERLGHLEPPLQRLIIAMTMPELERLMTRCAGLQGAVQQFVVRRAGAEGAEGASASGAAPAATPMEMEDDAAEEESPPDAAGAVELEGTIRLDIEALMDGRLRPLLRPARAAPPAAAAPARAPPAVAAALTPDDTVLGEWSEAVALDAERQRQAPAQPAFSDAYLSGAPPRKRKLMQHGKPHDLQHMMQECIREATRSAGAGASVGAGGGAGAAEGAAAEAEGGADASVRRAYWEHIRSLARARLCRSEDWDRERYPASHHYYTPTAPSKRSRGRPFPEDPTD